MFPDPPEDDRLTVFCETCETWRHPRHACARDSSHETAPLPILRLREEGPSTIEVFGDHQSGTNPESRRKYAIGKLNLKTHANGPMSRFGATKPVYYLATEHTPEEVIETWIGANEAQLRERQITAENITRALSKTEFKEAWQRLREEREFDVIERATRSSGGGDQSSPVECPFCGTTVPELPGHLPCEES